MTAYKTDQEAFWAGEFGKEYIQRNKPDTKNIAGALKRWSAILQHMQTPATSVLELGANAGINLRALHALLPQTQLDAVEINPAAATILRDWGNANIYEDSLLDFSSPKQFDLVFTSGVLIHLNPDFLPQVYDVMYKHSSRYICVMEYYNPTPVEIGYRGHNERMYKRDFAGEIIDRFPDVTLRHYGFFYSRDVHHNHGDLTWFLLEKNSR